MRNLEFLKSPIDYFYKIALLGGSKVEIGENNLLYINANNEICKGTSELIPCDYGSFAINTSALFFKGFYSINKYQYEQNWLYALILIEDNKCFVNIARFNIFTMNKLLQNGYELNLASTKEIHWKQPDNTLSNKIILYISDEWIKNILYFIPNIESNNWVLLRESIKGNNSHELEENHIIKNLSLEVLKNLNKRDAIYTQWRKEKVGHLMHEITKLIFEEKNKALSILSNKDLKKIILARNELIKDFQSPPISLDNLAKISGLNRQKFQEKFKEFFGMTFYQYYQEKRFEHAKVLIEQKGYSASEAAYAINYKHLGHFSHVFEKMHGIKPSELKNKNINTKNC